MRLTRRRAAQLLAAAPLTAPTGSSFRRGVNTWPWFSLTREYPAPRTDYPWPPWQAQRAVPGRADLRRLRQAGFDFIRIPVDPGPFLAFDEAKRGALLQDVMEAVQSALSERLSVIVNLHGNGATHHWTPDRMYSAHTAPALNPYLLLVEAFAARLGRLDLARVALEPVNEPPQACVSAEWAGLQIQLLSTARRAAPGLTLVATGACGSMPSGLVALDPAPLHPLEPLLYAFHFYEPYLFSHQGAPWMREPVYRALNNVPWPASAGSLQQTLASVRRRMSEDHGTSADERRAAMQETEKVLGVYFAAQPDRPFLRQYLGAVADWGTKHGIPSARLVMGEFGALRTDQRYTAAPAPDRARYVRDVRQMAEGFGFGWAFWNLFDGMGLMDDTTRALDPAMIEALGLRTAG